MKPSDKQALLSWEQYFKAFVADIDTDPDESPDARARRIRHLETNPEEWFAYYFPTYCTAQPAPFHRAATRRLLLHDRWYEVRAWSRELAKSARSMMEFLFLALTGKVKNLLLVSNSFDNACRLLLPFRVQLERNARIINDYGSQVLLGHWEDAEFVAKCGCSFRAIGAGQSPRGTRNEAARPDAIIVDDIDTDEECRNPDRIATKWQWIEEALIPTVSVSGNYRILFNGNIIAKDCCISRAIKKADHADIINITDDNGISSWPQKNSQADIASILSRISYAAQQKEYFNNPVSEGDTFKSIIWDRCPPLRLFRYLVIYADPSPSNNRKKKNSSKAAVLMGERDGIFYILDCRLDQATNDQFVDWLYELDAVANTPGVQTFTFIENNTLQDPFYQQVFIPLFSAKAKQHGHSLNVVPDARKKPDKFDRIEGNLEPLNRVGHLIFNSAQRNNPNMKRLEEQFKLVTPQLPANADGPDAVEGAVFVINQRNRQAAPNAIAIGRRRINNKKI